MLHTLFSTPRRAALLRRLDESRTISASLDAFDDILSDLAAAGLGGHPAVTRHTETDTAHSYTIELPGFKRDHVTVQIQEGLDGPYVAIVAQRVRVWTQNQPGGVATPDNACIERTITFPSDADSTKVEAKLEDGLLTVTVAKIAKPTPPAPRKVMVS